MFDPHITHRSPPKSPVINLHCEMCSSEEVLFFLHCSRCNIRHFQGNLTFLLLGLWIDLEPKFVRGFCKVGDAKSILHKISCDPFGINRRSSILTNWILRGSLYSLCFKRRLFAVSREWSSSRGALAFNDVCLANQSASLKNGNDVVLWMLWRLLNQSERFS